MESRPPLAATCRRERNKRGRPIVLLSILRYTPVPEMFEGRARTADAAVHYSVMLWQCPAHLIISTVCALRQSVSSTTDTLATSQFTGMSHPQSRRTNLEQWRTSSLRNTVNMLACLQWRAAQLHRTYMPRSATVLIPSRRQKISATSHV